MSGRTKEAAKSFFLIVLGIFIFQALFANAPAAAEKKIRVGSFTNESSVHISPENNEYGYSYEFLQEISQYYNWELEFVPETGKESLDGLSDGRVDILSHVHYGDELKDLVDYSTRESGSCRVGLYVLKSNESISPDDLSSFNGKRIGIFAPARQVQILEKSISDFGAKPHLVKFDTAENLTEALRNGSVDGALISENNLPEDLKLIKSFPEEPFYFAVAKGNRELLLKIDSAMQNILLMDPSFRNDLFKKHYGKNLAWESILTLEEKKFIEQSPILIVSYDPEWKPFEYYDKSNKQMAGINSEILKLVEEFTGLKMKIIHHTSWNEALRRMRDGELDILTGVNRSFIWGAKNNFRLTKAILNAPIVMVMNRKSGNMEETIALPRDYFLSEVVESFHKFDNVVYLGSQEECFDALVSNKVTATFANSYVANYLISLPRYRNLYTINYGELNEEVSFGISKRCDPILVSIINKAINSIPEETKNGIIIKHSYSRDEASFIDMIYEHHVELAKGITLVLIILVIGITMVAISKSIDKKRLKKLLYYDSLTGSKNYNSFKEEVPGIIKSNPDINFAMLFIDIVEFKFINSSFGYEEGDRVLKKVSSALEGLLEGPRETFARITADHFV
ncbi:MAG: transporter substrate-binding domain-containing protein, partial [Synergistaceae bacterium]|nr:transporter substrate-binding domain-containing protein [Synergistaceae bacterium]